MFLGNLDKDDTIKSKECCSFSKEYKDDAIKSLADLWLKACKVHFNDDDGKAVHSRLQKNENENTHRVWHVGGQGSNFGPLKRGGGPWVMVVHELLSSFLKHH